MIKKNEIGIVLLLALLPLLLLPILKLTGFVIYANQDSSMQVETNQTLFYYENFTIYANLIGPGAAASTFNCTYNASNLVYGNMTYDGSRFFATNKFPTGILGTVTMDVNCSNATGYLNISTIPYTIVKDSSLNVSTSLPYGVKGYNITFYAWYNETDRAGNNVGKINFANCSLSIDGYNYTMNENGVNYYITLSNLTREINKKYNVTCSSNSKYNITYENMLSINNILESTIINLGGTNFVRGANLFVNLSMVPEGSYIVYTSFGTGALYNYNLSSTSINLNYNKLAEMNNSIGTIIADIDNDLKYEILFSNASGTYNLELNDQGTNIQKISNFNSANASSYGHFTSKIDNEIAIIDDSDKQLKIVNLSYSIIRSTKIFADAVGWKVQSCLFNGSSLNDLLLYKESQQKLFYVINDGSTFVNYSIAATPIEKVSCDYFNNDEYMDIIIRNQMGFIVFLNNNGLFDPLNNITSENVPNINADRSSFVVGDINKDLKKEIIYTGSSAGVLAENGNSLILVQNLSEQYNYSSVTLYDYDNDNDLDLFIIGAQGGYKHTILENKINVIDSNETKPDANLSYYRDGNIFTFIITNKTRYEDNYLLGIGSESVKEDVLSSKIPFSLSITSQKSIATPIRYVGNLGRKKEFNLTLSSNSDLYFNLYAVSPLNKVHFLQQLHYQPAGCVMINNTAWQIISSCDINATSTPTSITINEGGTLKVNSDTYFNLNDILEIQNRGTLNITKSLNKNGTMHIYNYANSSINVFNSLLNVSYLDCNNCSFNITNSSVLGGIMYIRDTNSTFNDCVLENLTLEYMNLTLNNCSYNHSTESDSKITQRWWLSFFNNSNVLVNISAGSYDLLNQVVNTGSRVLLENKSYTITLSKPLSETTTSVLNLVDNINYDLYLSPGYPEFTLNPYTTNFSNYSIEELVSLTGFTVGNSNSSITFLSNVDVRGRNFTALVNNFYNSVFVNDTFYNSYAIIAIRNLPYNKMPLVYRDGALCGSNCTIISYNSALLNFSVGGFSTYQAMANSGINVSTYSQRGINIHYIDFEIKIDYKNISTSAAIQNAVCDVNINSVVNRINEANRTGQYYIYRVNLSSGTYLYTINCSSDAGENQTTSGTFIVYPEGNYLIGKNVSSSITSHGIFVYNNEMYDFDTTNANGIKYNFTTESQSALTIPKDKRVYYDLNNDGTIDLSEYMVIS